MRKKQETSQELQVFRASFIIKGLQKKVGTVDSENLGYGSALVSKVRRKNGYCVLYRRPGGDKEDTHAS